MYIAVSISSFGNDDDMFVGNWVFYWSDRPRGVIKGHICPGVLLSFCVTNMSRLLYVCVYMSVWMLPSVHGTDVFCVFWVAASLAFMLRSLAALRMTYGILVGLCEYYLHVSMSV
jgi:hypothetical protein